MQTWDMGHFISLHVEDPQVIIYIQLWRIWGRAEREEPICQIFHMLKHFIMFSPNIWAIMTVTRVLIDMFISTYEDLLAPAHYLGGPKIQQSCSSIKTAWCSQTLHKQWTWETQCTQYTSTHLYPLRFKYNIHPYCVTLSIWSIWSVPCSLLALSPHQLCVPIKYPISTPGVLHGLT